MESALWAAKTGLDAQQTRMAVTANNLANVSTTGFKKGRAVFEDLLYQNVRQVGAAELAGHAAAFRPVARHRRARRRDREALHPGQHADHRQRRSTSRSTAAASSRSLLPDGSTGYTRDGTFQVNAQGQLVTANGYIVQPAISIPNGAQSVTIGTDGVVSVQLAGQAAPTQVGTLQLVDFVNPAGLQPRGENLLLESGSSGAAQAGTPGLNGLGSLQSGALEASNVNVVEELVSMIETQRAYEMNSKAISTTDQMLEYLTTRL